MEVSVMYKNKRGPVTSGRKALSVLLLIVFFLIISLFITRGTAVGQTHSEPTARYISIQIEEGDSLWSIASRYKEPSQDITHFMDSIRRVNHLTSDQIIASEYLIIPLLS